jgi:hypothetical protein
MDRIFFKYTAWTKWRVLLLRKMVRIITTVLRLWQKYVALCSQQGKLTSEIQECAVFVMGGSVHGKVQCAAYRRMGLNKEAWLYGWRRGGHKSLWQIPRSWIVVAMTTACGLVSLTAARNGQWFFKLRILSYKREIRLLGYWSDL